MKKIILSIVCFFCMTTVFAQCAIIKGESQINAGVGLSSFGIPVYVGFDYGVHPDFSVGGNLSFRSYNEGWGGVAYNHSIIGISVNGNYHFNSMLTIPKKWDIYGGGNLGYYVWLSSTAYAGSHASGIGAGIQIGARHYFNQRLALHLELSGGNAFTGSTLGISYKL